jgi:putative heme transporter
MDADQRVESGGAVERRSGRRLTFRIALQVVVIGAIAYFFTRERALFAGFGAAISRLNWYWVILAVVAELASVPFLAEAQRVVLRTAGVEAGRVAMNLVTLASNAIATSLPAGVAFAESYSFTRYRRFGADNAVAAWAELASGAIAFCALAGIALAGALVPGSPGSSVVLPILAVVFAGSAAAAALFRHPRVLVDAVDWLLSHVGGPAKGPLTRVAARFCELVGSLNHVRPPVTAWAAAFVLSSINWLLDALCLAWAFAAVNLPVPWGAVLLAFAGAKVLSSIGITPGGLGLVEGSLVAVLIAYGVPGAGAGVAVLVYRAITIVGIVLLGWLAVAVLAVGPHQLTGVNQSRGRAGTRP